MPESAEMAVVVIGFRAQPGLVNAVASLLAQDEQAEIVVVNTGGGDPVRLLAAYAARIRIINVTEPLFVGAARNIGIDASVAPYIAFLAGDCRARPGWIRNRLASHRKGARAVASAIAPPDDQAAHSLAAHLCLFGARSPQTPAPQALRYGVSYARQIFSEFGYFNSALRIGEDSEFTRRLGRYLLPSWNPRVQTEHDNPASAVRLFFDMYRRGQRAAIRPAADARTEIPSEIFKSLRQNARRRTDIAIAIGRNLLGLHHRQLRSIKAHLIAANLAQALGLAVGARRFLRAKADYRSSITHRGKGKIRDALARAKGAVHRDPENVPFRLHYAELLLAHAQDTVAADAHISTAIWLSAFNAKHHAALADWLIERGFYDYAWRLGDTATYCLPADAAVHLKLAQAADAIGDRSRFEVAAFRAVTRDPSLVQLIARLKSTTASP